VSDETYDALTSEYEPIKEFKHSTVYVRIYKKNNSAP